MSVLCQVGNMVDNAQVLVAVHPFQLCTIQHNIWYVAMFSLPPLPLAEINIELTLFTTARQCLAECLECVAHVSVVLS